jgi:hypothetical protein
MGTVGSLTVAISFPSFLPISQQFACYHSCYREQLTLANNYISAPRSFSSLNKCKKSRNLAATKLVSFCI